MSGGILTQGMNGSKWVPVTNSREVELSSMEHAAALLWAQHSQRGRKQFIDEVLPETTDAGVFIIMGLSQTGVITIDEDGRIFMPDVTRAALLGED